MRGDAGSWEKREYVGKGRGRGEWGRVGEGGKETRGDRTYSVFRSGQVRLFKSKLGNCNCNRFFIT